MKFKPCATCGEPCVLSMCFECLVSVNSGLLEPLREHRAQMQALKECLEACNE